MWATISAVWAAVNDARRVLGHRLANVAEHLTQRSATPGVPKVVIPEQRGHLRERTGSYRAVTHGALILVEHLAPVGLLCGDRRRPSRRSQAGSCAHGAAATAPARMDQDRRATQEWKTFIEPALLIEDQRGVALRHLAAGRDVGDLQFDRLRSRPPRRCWCPRHRDVGVLAVRGDGDPVRRVADDGRRRPAPAPAPCRRRRCCSGCCWRPGTGCPGSRRCRGRCCRCDRATAHPPEPKDTRHAVLPCASRNR